MKTQLIRSCLFGLLFPAALSVCAAERKYSWQTGSASVALLSEGKTVWQFNHDPDTASKPFFHPLALPGGEPATWQSPADHVWHYGLWFSWKYLNGVNYWEEDQTTRQSEGVTSWRLVQAEMRPDFSARFELALDYRPRQAAAPVLIERRQIQVGAPAADGSYALDWQLEFQAGNEAVKFDRTPLPGEPGGQVYGGYAGLSVRFAQAFTNTQINASSPVGAARDHRYRFSAAAADYSGQLGGPELGIAFFDHPANLRHPTRWYAIVNPSAPFAFLNAAWLQQQPFELAAQDKFTLRYRVLVHPGRWEEVQLDALHRQYATATGGAKPSDRRLLVFTKNGKGYVHDNIASSVAALRKLGAENDLVVEVTDDPAAFTDENLGRYRVLVFSNTNNELFDNDGQRAAFQRYLRAGGGFVAIHSACASERQWPWFWSMVGCKFVRHPRYQPFTLTVCDTNHVSTAHLGDSWRWTDEFYYLDHLNPNVQVLLAGDRASLVDEHRGKNEGEQIAGQSPLAWCHEFEGGRVWYTALGHSPEHYTDPRFTRHLLGGIQWAMGATNRVAH
jgi:type 1 glutamine amidotransferase